MFSRIAISLLLLLPVYWHPRIQAGDLGSHTYNAWLAQLVEQGKAPGLEIVPQRTNVLFDLALAWLFPRVGPDWAERLLLSAAVLLFFWGAGAFVCRASGERPWFLLPCLAMLTYGWTYHMGLFNFYLSCGLVLLALAIAWDGRRAGLLLMAVAWVAHPLPVLWGGGVVLYEMISARLPDRVRWVLFPAAIVAVVAVRLLLEWKAKTTWVSLQLFSMTAIDQFWVFGIKYYVVALCVGALWGFLVLRLSYLYPWRELLAQIPLQLAVLTSLTIVLVPTAIEGIGYRLPLSFVAERMTLLLGVLVCVLLAKAQPLPWQRALTAALAAVYFVFLYVDTGVLTRIESRMEMLVRSLPPGSRVVAPFYDPGSRVFVLGHTIDRVCTGRCFSYGNYEPSSTQFRLRATQPNVVVLHELQDRLDLNAGRYVVKARDEPLFQIAVCGPRLETDLCLKPLHTGQTVERVTVLAVTPLLF
ncbi:MAG: hypothetical protein JNK87_25515 [Bryobacterales bacterium]|nr:hypothetical protein [Bryobacterales bacterium]